MKLTLPYSTVYLACVLCGGCTKDVPTAKDGVMYFAGGSLRELDLTTGETATVHLWADSEVEAVDIAEVAGRKVFVLSGYILSPTEERAQILLYDPSSGQQRTLFPGSLAVTVGVNTVAFYDERIQLSIANLDDKLVVPMLVEPSGSPWLVPVLPISDTEFLYESSRDGERGVWKYNIQDHQNLAMPQFRWCSLERAIWRSRANQLLCHRLEADGSFGRGYVLMGVDGAETDLGMAGTDFWPIAYVDERDAMILQTGRIGSAGAEEYPVWLYSFSTGELLPIAENLSVGKRAVYVKERLSTL